MQKTPLSRILREELIRAAVFGIGFFTILSLGFVSVTYAANGGKFGEMLNLILTGNIAGEPGRTWDTTADGTVHNAKMLDGHISAEFVKAPIATTIKTCDPGYCMRGFEPDGDVDCIDPTP